MRIVLIVHQFLPRHSAGTEQLTLKVALGLRALGAEVTIIAAEPNGGSGPAIGHDSVRDIPVIRLEGVAILDPFVTVRNPSGDALIREALQHSAPDLIHMFHFNHVGVGAIDIAEELGIPLLFTATDFWWRCPLERLQGPDEKRCDGPGPLGANCARHRLVIGSQDRPWLKRVADALPAAAFVAPLALARAAAPLSPRVARLARLSRRQDVLRGYAERVSFAMAPTQAVYDEMLAAGFAPGNLRLLPFGIDTPAVSRETRPARPFTIGFIGTLREHKGAHFLLEAAAQLTPGLQARIAIYGDRATDPGYAGQLDALAARAAVPVTFHGGFAEDQIGKVLDTFDIVVVPSLWMENRPLVLLSSLLARKPVIVTDQPGLTCEVVHGENGLVVPPDDAAALAGAMALLASDASLRETIAAHPRRPKAIGAFVEELAAIYSDIVLARRSA